MSARPILGHLLPKFDGFSSKLIAKFSLKIVTFVVFNTLLPPGSKFCPEGGRGNFHFSADFHEYTLIMTSYEVAEEINACF